MSSSKDYKLDITPSDIVEIEDTNILNFKITNKQLNILDLHKRSIILITTCILIIHFLVNYKQIIELHRLPCVSFIILAFCIILLIFKRQSFDSMIVMKGIGIQLIHQGSFQTSNTFIPISNMIDLVIHEGFHNYGQVIFYLCVLTKSKQESNVIQIVFPNYLPRKDILLKVWKSSRQLLFGTSTRYYRRIPGKGLTQVN